ncbi:MAG: hypothetical protein CM1200mP18_23240 [Gammaproteobacteria bacterium]|nr:MAG: hypothetical protein CM1200mP18_23240 [Gammaproteobacteria bacterium]
MVMTLSYFADLESLSNSDCIIHSAPLSHGSGIYGIPHLAKAANQVIPESGGFDPLETNELLVKWPSSGFFFAPTMIVRLLASGAISEVARAHLRTIIYGGGADVYPGSISSIRCFWSTIDPNLWAGRVTNDHYLPFQTNA